MVNPPKSTITPQDSSWVSNQHSIGMEGLKKSGKKGCFEIQMSLLDHYLNAKQSELLEAAEKAQIESHGWPLGVVMPNIEYSPKPKANGIIAEIDDKSSYDFWVIGKNGTFYLLKSFDGDSDPRYTSIFV